MNVIGTLVGSISGRESDAESDAADGPDSALFRCPRCDTVYIAAEKDTCSDCETAVSRVPSTLEDR